MDDLSFQATRSGFGPPQQWLRAGQKMFREKYELVRQLGAGGMGVVWLARDLAENVDVALKFLPAVLAHDSAEMARVRDEVRAGKELRHPRLVATYALEVEHGIAAIVMEHVPGQTLKELLEANERGFFEPAEIAGWVWDVCDALLYLHGEAQRLHRDIKPANILVDAAGRARLMDFGISQRIQESVTRQSKISEGQAGGESSSTLAYASPQQLAGKATVLADDLYSLGASLYELLTGTPPFYRGTMAVVGFQIATQPVTPIMERRAELVAEGVNASASQSVPAAVEATVRACLAKEREARPATAADVMACFYPEQTAADAPPVSPPPGGPHQSGPLTPVSGTQAETPAPSPPAARSPGGAPETSSASPSPVPRRGLHGPLWAAAVPVVLALAAWAFFPKPGESINEGPKPVRHIEAKATAGSEAAPPAAATVPTATNSAPPPAALAGASAPPSHSAPPASATKDAPFTNSLGMKFVPVPINAGPSKGQRILFSIWETRSKDYAAFVKDSGYEAGGAWEEYRQEYRYDFVAPVGRGEGESAGQSSHPVANVSHDDALAFCAWLTKKDRASGLIGSQDEYRLPSDVEWSYAVGIGDQESASASPEDRDGAIKNVYPWGNGYPPPASSGNYADTMVRAKFSSDWSIIEGYSDGYATTAPVGSFKANTLGLYDLGGNLGEWTNSPWQAASTNRVVRGASWFVFAPELLLSSDRFSLAVSDRAFHVGFRCVLQIGSSESSKSSDASAALPPSSPPSAMKDEARPTANETSLSQGSVGKQVEVTLPGGLKLALCYCPAGSFTMGSPASEEDRSEDEDQVEVTLTQSFWLARTELTQAQWRALMGTDPSEFKGDDLPVENVSAEGADAFIIKLNEQVPLGGWKWMLPSEAQWEYACRAGTTTPFSFGRALDGKQANCDGTRPYGIYLKGPYQQRTVKVGSYEPNPWGLCDMHGNVWEWCADAWDGVSKLPGGTDPIWTLGGPRVVRGGSWSFGASNCRAADRGFNGPGVCDNHLGFRPALVPSR